MGKYPAKGATWGRIDTKTETESTPDDPGDDTVPAWDRLLDGDASAYDDLTAEEKARLASFAAGGWDAVYDRS